MLTFGYHFNTIPVVGCRLPQGICIDVEPGERLANIALVLHPEALLSVVVHFWHIALKHIAYIRGIAQHLTIRGKNFVEQTEERRHTVECSYNADTVHQHQNGVVLAASNAVITRCPLLCRLLTAKRKEVAFKHLLHPS